MFDLKLDFFGLILIFLGIVSFITFVWSMCRVMTGNTPSNHKQEQQQQQHNEKAAPTGWGWYIALSLSAIILLIIVAYTAGLFNQSIATIFQFEALFMPDCIHNGMGILTTGTGWANPTHAPNTTIDEIYTINPNTAHNVVNMILSDNTYCMAHLGHDESNDYMTVTCRSIPQEVYNKGLTRLSNSGIAKCKKTYSELCRFLDNLNDEGKHYLCGLNDCRKYAVRISDHLLAV